MVCLPYLGKDKLGQGPRGLLVLGESLVLELTRPLRGKTMLVKIIMLSFIWFKDRKKESNSFG